MSKKLYRSFVLLLVFGLLGAMLGGCGTKATPTPAPVVEEEPTDAPAAVEPTTPPAAEEEPTAAPEVKEPVTLKVWIVDRVGANAMDTVKQSIQAWADETGNTVEITEGAQFEMMTKIPTAIPAGEGPDVFMNINSYVGMLSIGDLIVPLNDLIPAEELAEYTQGSLDSFTLDGKLYGVPLAADVNALLYNKALVPEPPKTMAELITMSKEMTKGDKYGFMYTIDAFWYSYPFVSASGGYVFNWDGKTFDVKDVGFDNEGSIAGLQYVVDLVKVEKLMPADVTWDVMNSFFSSGQSAMTISNPTMLPTFKDAGIDVGVARIPQMDNGKYPHPFATYTGFSVSAYSEHPQESAALASYLGLNLPLPLYQANPGNIPVYQPMFENDAVKEDADLAAWISQLEESDPLPNVNEMNLVWVPATTAYTAAVHGDMSAEEALKAAQQQILDAIAAQ
ncbi:MAG TPA: extracellular solute-binding protein [Anaerolineaceae bacterium]|nr:extracellular solute-binding protein [Anaerolineaceae bacterium]